MNGTCDKGKDVTQVTNERGSCGVTRKPAVIVPSLLSPDLASETEASSTCARFFARNQQNARFPITVVLSSV